MTPTGTDPIQKLFEYRHDESIRLFQALFQIWKRKEDLVAKMIEFELIPLTLDSRHAYPHLGLNRLFSQIMLKINAADQLPYTKALLEAFAECCRRNVDSGFGLPIIVRPWHNMYQSTSWNQFEASLKVLEFHSFYNKDICKVTLQTILDYTTVLVGKRLLKDLEKRMDASLGNLEAYGLFQRESMKIVSRLLELRHLFEPNECSWVPVRASEDSQ